VVAGDDERLLGNGDEAGTAPSDRKLRPDVEGMRAVAILLVLFSHFFIPVFTAGGVGVDVFFVISGFVITGVLLRERDSTGRTSLPHFYAQRGRRIIPLAMLVVVVILVCERLTTGTAGAAAMASPARWVVFFAFNFDYSAIRSEIFRPAPFASFWSLAVEEQFYLVYPALVIAVGVIGKAWSWRLKINVVLIAAVAASYIWSVVSSGVFALVPYDSPFTRAWELAVGCLIAVNTPSLRRISKWVAGAMSWLGLALVLVAAQTITLATRYPGWVAILPVAGAALVIIGGIRVPSWGAESFLGLRPVRAIGRWSYGIYLWEIPVYLLATYWWGPMNRIPLVVRVCLIAVTVVIAAASFAFYESPIRHSPRLVAKPSLSLVCALAFIVGTLVVISFIAH
jgi:peptidoglycan/LPS O-acetylase OafA/YrhL